GSRGTGHESARSRRRSDDAVESRARRRRALLREPRRSHYERPKDERLDKPRDRYSGARERRNAATVSAQGNPGITAAADGSALGNPGPAGWAWVIDEQQWRAGGWPRATNNQGELMAVLDLLHA